MKSFVLGCLSLFVGALFGAAIMFVLLSILNVRVLARPPVSEALLLPDRPDVTITASSAFLKPQLEQVIVKTGLVRQAQVELIAPNTVQVRSPVTFSVFGQSMTVDASVKMVVSVQQGRIILTAGDVEASGLTMSPSVLGSDFERMRTAAEAEVNREAQSVLQGTRLVVSNVRVASDALSVDLKTR